MVKLNQEVASIQNKVAEEQASRASLQQEIANERVQLQQKLTEQERTWRGRYVLSMMESFVSQHRKAHSGFMQS